MNCGTFGGGGVGGGGGGGEGVGSSFKVVVTVKAHMIKVFLLDLLK